MLDSQKYEEAIKIAQQVLSTLDPNSGAAKTIIEKAQTAMKNMAEQKMGDVKNAIGSLGVQTK